MTGQSLSLPITTATFNCDMAFSVSFRKSGRLYPYSGRMKQSDAMIWIA
jgi:hypothetical protein